MSVWRLSALSSGTSQKIAPALLPVPAVDAGAKNSREKVNGFPAALVPAPAPVPGIRLDASLVAQAIAGGCGAGGMGLPSSAFHFWKPSIYWVNSHERAPVSRISDNQMPVPAQLPGHMRLPLGGGLGSQRPYDQANVMAGGIFRGPFQVLQPRVTPKYPNLNRPGKRKPRA